MQPRAEPESRKDDNLRFRVFKKDDHLAAEG